MGDVLSFPRPVPTDGGKARIESGRMKKGLSRFVPMTIENGAGGGGDSLVMLHADPEPYIAPPCDCA